METTKICLIGKSRSGKDEAASYLNDNYGFTQFAFGDELKKEFHSKYPHISREPKPSRGYQLYGQLQRYVENDNYWVDKCFSNIGIFLDISEKHIIQHESKSTSNESRIIITDVRQSNEIERCKEEGFITIKIEADDEIRKNRMIGSNDKPTSFEEFNNFSTEKELDSFECDYVIANNSSVEEFHDKIKEIIENVVLIKGLGEI